MTGSRFPALPPQSAVKIGILIFDEVEELDFVGPLEVFGMAGSSGPIARPWLRQKK